MGNRGQISFVLRGPRGSAELSDFVQTLEALRLFLTHACRCIIGEDDVEYDVSNLSYSSACITAEPVPGRVSREDLLMVSDAVEVSILSIASGGDPDSRLDYLAIRSLRGFATVASRRSNSLTVADTLITRRFGERLDVLLAPEAKALGSVTGRLEQVSIHKKTTFTLYPRMAAESIECEFAPDELARVLALVGRTITVYGTLRYARAKKYPTSVVATSFEAHPERGSIPSLLNAPCTGMAGADSVNTVREMRDEWK